MNILHLKYAVEVARCGSLNKAADRLYIEPSNLSRAIKGLENTAGVTIFDRSSKGMFLTPDGEIFIRHAVEITDQIENLEKLFAKGPVARPKFAVSAPRTAYIAEAFMKFSMLIDSEMEIDVYYNETDSATTIRNITENDYKLGIVRYASEYDGEYKEVFDERGIVCEQVSEFTYSVAVNKNSPLADKAEISYEDLADFTEVAYPDIYMPSMPFEQVRGNEDGKVNIKRRMYVYERASGIELVGQNPKAFMWVSPVPKKIVDRWGFVQKKCIDNTRVYKDVLIRKKDYMLTELDKKFIAEVYASKKRSF